MKYFTTVILVAATLTTLGCKKSSSVTGPGGQQGQLDLIGNSSCEQGGVPSIAGWRQSYPDTGFIHFSSDVPVNGGQYSVSLKNGWGPLPSLQAIVPAPSGTHQYRISLWSKTLPLGPLVYASGGVSIRQKAPDTLIFHKWLTFSDTVWTEHMLLDTIVTKQDDSLVVSISGGQSQWSSGQTLFDLVRFIKLD